MRLGVTVVVCTYNGAALIPKTLEHIAQQRVNPGIPWEVVVIDNASTDNTSSVVLEEWEKYDYPAPLKLLYQPRQGLTFARIMALEESRYEFVLFCDDDNWLNQDYVNTAYELMIQHPRIGVLGGLGELVYEKDPPEWTQAFRMFGNGPQEKSSGKVKRNIVYGAGCVLRRSALKRILNAGYKPFLTDRSANNLSSGGDYEICYVLSLIGYDIWYDERLHFKHYMPKERCEWKYYERFFIQGAQCNEVLIPYEIIINYGVQSISTFYLKLLRSFLYSVKQWNILMLNKVNLPADSNAAKVNTLKLKRVKARIWNFRKLRAMRNNFVQIRSFKQEYLSAFTPSETKFISPKFQMEVKFKT
jgi:glycosyltransferase involved in cell wall biosynthesis